MQFSDVVKMRYSVRSYKPDEIEDKSLQQVLEAACLAPTASNRQPFKFIVISTSSKEKELRRIYDKDWFVQAPLIICACGIPHQAWIRNDGKNYFEVDVAIAMDHLILAAADIGLGTCWIVAFEPSAARDILDLPDDLVPIAFTPLGYPKDEPKPKKRKALEELVEYKNW